MPRRDPVHMSAQRERILRAAIRCISDVGLERTSVARICKQAALSAGAIYKHFAGKEEIIAQALRFAATTDTMLPDGWPEFKAFVADIDDQMGFDVNTVMRARLQLFASSLRPGPLHDMLKPLLDESLLIAVRHLEGLEKAGRIRLKMTPLQTAMAISALADGLMWVGLASDRTPDAISRDIAAAMECLVDAPD